MKSSRMNIAIMLSIASLMIMVFACNLPFLGQQAIYPLRTKEGMNYVDREGEIVLETDYFQAGEFYEGFAAVMPDIDDAEWGFIDREGEIVIRPRYDAVWRFSENYAAVMVDSRWGAVDEDGSLVIEPQFFQPFEFSDGLAAVTLVEESADSGLRLPGESGFIDTDGEFVIGPLRGIVRGNFVDGLAPVSYLDKNGFIGKDGEIVIELDEDIGPAGPFSEGLAPAVDRRRQIETGECSFGYVDKDGEWAIEPQFCEAHPFVEGLARVRTGTDFSEPSYGFIDTNGRLVIDDDFMMVWDFYNGLVKAFDEDWDGGYINKDGRWVFRDE